MLKSSLCGYSDTYILVKGTITVAPAPVPAANLDNNYNNKEAVFNWLYKWNEQYTNR